MRSLSISEAVDVLIERINSVDSEIDSLKDHIRDDLEQKIKDIDSKVAVLSLGLDELKESLVQIEKSVSTPSLSFAIFEDRLISIESHISSSKQQASLPPDFLARQARLENIVYHLSEEIMGTPETNAIWRRFQ